jgi:hypothetical protein
MTSWSRRVSSAAHRQALREVASATADDDGGIERGLSGQQVRSILTDTLVETPDMVAIFASVGREAMWANDAFVTLIPIREADQIWLVELMVAGSLRGEGVAGAGEVRSLARAAHVRL